MVKKTYYIEGMHCTSCALLIEGELEDAGIKATVDYAKGTLTAEFDEKKRTDEDVFAAVKKAGYDIR